MPLDPDPGEGGVIIIKGGSCEIHFDNNVFQEDMSNPSDPKYTHSEFMIHGINIKGDATFDEAFPNGFTGEITITYGL